MPTKPRKPANSSNLQLGRAVEWPDRPEKAQIDRVPNPQKGTDYLVRFTVPEFTSICPVTGQPDFAHLVIDYAPGPWLLEFEIAEALSSRAFATTAPSTRIARS